MADEQNGSADDTANTGTQDPPAASAQGDGDQGTANEGSAEGDKPTA